MKSPLQLHRYYLEEIALKANPGFKIGSDISGEGFKVFFETGDDNDPLFRRIRLTIEQNITIGGNQPFGFKAVMVGFFEVANDYLRDQGKEKTARLVAVNGSALLYSAAREILALVSGRGPYMDKGFDVLLPSISFLGFQPFQEGDKGSDDSGSLEGKPQRKRRVNTRRKT